MKTDLEADPGHGETTQQGAPLAQRPLPAEPAPVFLRPADSLKLGDGGQVNTLH